MLFIYSSSENSSDSNSGILGMPEKILGFSSCAFCSAVVEYFPVPALLQYENQGGALSVGSLLHMPINQNNFLCPCLWYYNLLLIHISSLLSILPENRITTHTSSVLLNSWTRKLPSYPGYTWVNFFFPTSLLDHIACLSSYIITSTVCYYCYCSNNFCCTPAVRAVPCVLGLQVNS